MRTHKFPLSGVETEVTNLGGVQQGILTKGKDHSEAAFSAKLYEMVPTVVKRVGSVIIDDLSEKEREVFFKTMLAPHVKQILTEVRMFTYQDEDFVFTFGYNATDPGTQKKTKKEAEMVLDVSDGFPVVPVKRFDTSLLDGKKKLSDVRKLIPTLEPLEATEYSQVVANSELSFTLPVSGLQIKCNMRNGLSSQIVLGIKEGQRDSNASILSTNPKFKEPEGGWINYDLGRITKADAMDLDYIRMVLKAFEGRVDTELEFDHPEIEGKKEVTDLLSQIAFFFPSEGI